MMITTAILILAQTAATPPAAPRANAPTRANVLAQAKANFEATDSNRDGRIEPAEADRTLVQRARAQRDAQFARMDSNKDNMISKQEFEAAMTAGRRNPNSASWFAAVDKDKNGSVSLAEMSAVATASFDRVDTNRDGVLAPAEVQASRNRAPAPRR